jgi:integrase
VALLWSDLDAERKTVSVTKQAYYNGGEVKIIRPKTSNSVRKISIAQDVVDLPKAEHDKHPDHPWMFPSDMTGEMYFPDSVVNLHKKILRDAGLEDLRFHDLRHPFAAMALRALCDGSPPGENPNLPHMGQVVGQTETINIAPPHTPAHNLRRNMQRVTVMLFASHMAI